MNPTFKTIARPNVVNRHHKNCFLCDGRIQNAQIRNIDQLFYEDSKNNHTKSLATILSDVLEQTIDESTAHSKIVCRNCQQMCSDYDRLTSKLQELRQSITTNFNETANKYNLKIIEMDLEQHNFEAINENEDSNIPNMYAIESVDSTIGEVFNNENVNQDVSKATQLKKVMLIKGQNGSNPFFTISHMDESIDDDQAIHTVSLRLKYLTCLLFFLFSTKSSFS